LLGPVHLSVCAPDPVFGMLSQNLNITHLQGTLTKWKESVQLTSFITIVLYSKGYIEEELKCTLLSLLFSLYSPGSSHGAQWLEKCLEVKQS
jgi:hypothetical protein